MALTSTSFVAPVPFGKAATGAGSRGGKILGYTATGRAIYQDARPGSSVYHGMEPRDHATAARLHAEAGAATPDARTANAHAEAAEAHKAAWRQQTSITGRIGRKVDARLHQYGAMMRSLARRVGKERD